MFGASGQKPTGFASPFQTGSGNSTGFGTQGFGTSTQQAPGGSLFGQAGTSTPGGLFGGQTAGTSAFGQQSTTGFGFGSATPSASGGLFGQKSTTTSTGLFGATTSATPGFGFGGTGTTAFGSQQQSTGAGLFGGSSTSGGGLFGTSTSTGANAFGTQQQQSGTTVKYDPLSGQDTMVKNGVTQTISTKHQCITAMKQYENKSLEELRFEDYGANRKGKQQTTGGFGFSSPAAGTTPLSSGFSGFGATSGFGASTGFGTSTSTGTGGLFGQQTASQTPAAGGLFGSTQNKPLFGAATTTQSGFGFGTNTSTGTGGGLFGTQNKPLFGATTATTQPSLFGNTSTNTFGQTASSGFGGFGTSQAGGLFAKPAFGTQTTASAGGFNFGGQNTSSNMFAKPFSTPSTGFGFNAPTQATGFGGTQGFGQNKTGFGLATTSAPAFNFGGSGLNTGTSLFNNNLAKPGDFGNLGTTGFGGFNAASALNPGANMGLGSQQGSADNSALLQQTLLALTHSPYGDSPLFMNMKESSTKREDVLKPTNPAAQKAVMANHHKVSPRPVAKIRPKTLHGRLSGGKAQIFEGLEDDDFSFGNETFQPRKSVKKLTIKKSGYDSGTSSRGSSLSGEPQNISTLREDEQRPGRSSPIIVSARAEPSVPVNVPESENIIRSKGISQNMDETSNRGPSSMDDTIAMLNEKNKNQNQETFQVPNIQDDSVNISIVSRDDSINTPDTSMVNERPLTPPPPHPAGIVLTRPDYYTIPSLENLGDMVDESGNCHVEDFTIGREGYGSIFFPGFTNVANMNFDEMVYFRRKEVIVYPDEENKPPVGEGLNKKAEITLDCVWPRDKSIGTPIKSPEKLHAMGWQNKIEENSAKLGVKFIDYRQETGSWVFEVKHFSKYGLVDDSDDEEASEQEKKRLKTMQQQQHNVQKQKIQQEDFGKGDQLQLRMAANGQMAKFTIGTDDDESEASTARHEVPMGDDDPLIGMGQGRVGEFRSEIDEEEDEMEIREELPSSHRLATSMQVDARNMQVMKASFFGEDDIPASALGSMFAKQTSNREGSPMLRQPEGRGPSLFSSAMKSSYLTPVKLSNLPLSEPSDERSLFSPRLITPEPKRAVQTSFQPPVKEYLLLASGMTQQDVPKKLIGAKMTRTVPHVRESYMYGKQNLMVDAGLFMGRSFRVGWGPGWTLAHSGDVIQPTESEERPSNNFNLFMGNQRRQSQQGTNNWSVQLQKLNIADHIHPMDKSVIQNHCEMLEIQLVHSVSSTERECPVFAPAPGVEALHQYAEQNQVELNNLSAHPDESTVKHMGMVWDLCVALWGNLPQLEDKDAGRDSYMFNNARREAVTRWLSSVSSQVIRREVQEHKYEDQGHLQVILSSLTGKQIMEACQVAQEAGDHKLALLLSQAVSSFMPRQMVNKQLEEWIELGVDDHIKELRLKIYSLLSGQLVLSCPNTTINTCEGLDWKRAFALHLWFYCQADSPIQEAVEMFDRAYQGSGDYSAYCSPPLPPYLEDSNVWDVMDRDNQITDMCYHLLCLYCQKRHMLEEILNPVTSTTNQLDYRLSWHLSQVLQSLSYKRMSPYHRASLHMNFASHLESIDLWEWAIFVALHIDNSVSRETAVKSILNRHIELSDHESYMEKEELLRDKLMVPSSWIHYAKALRANYENKHKEEAWHLLMSGHWNKSHEIVLKYIAPDAIIYENYEELKQYLLEMAVPAHTSTILDWHIGGKVYLDYINICEGIQQLSREEEPSPYELDRLLPEVKSLCTKVNSIPCSNSKERLCQSEMAKKAANLLRVILTLQCQARGEAQPPIRLLAPNISNLPMPEDYSLQELRALVRSYTVEQTVQ